MTNEYRKVSELREWKDNPRSITKEAFERLKKHITDHGQMQPLVITNDGEVLGGNMRLKAYRELGINDIWIKVVEPKDENDKLRIALVLNDRAGFYDDDLLANLLPNYDIDWSQYSVDLKEPTNLRDLLDQFKEVVEDEMPEVSDEPAVSKLGEVYQLGKHRLMCGDATKLEDVEKLMDGKKADMVFTDPPYGQSFDIKGDTKSEYRGIFDGAIGAITIFAKDNYYICCNYACIGYFAYRVEELGLQIYDKVVWYKNLFGQGTLYHRQHEDIIFCGNGNYLKDKRNDDVDVWQINSMRNFAGNKTAKEDVGHPTQKPSELSARAIKNSSKQDDIVLDLFGGSGSTLIACEQTNRTCYMMEIDPKYCDVIRKRYANYIEKGGSWQMETPKI